MGIASVFVQDNVSQSQRGVLRGLHFQYPRSQAKLVTVVRGEVFDVAVDVRVGSPTFGAWTGEILSADNNHQLYVPGGFAHGFLVLSPDAVVVYKTSDYYDPDTEGVIRWNDPALGIRWPIEPTSLSDRDRNARTLSELANLPRV